MFVARWRNRVNLVSFTVSSSLLPHWWCAIEEDARNFTTECKRDAGTKKSSAWKLFCASNYSHLLSGTVIEIRSSFYATHFQQTAEPSALLSSTCETSLETIFCFFFFIHFTSSNIQNGNFRLVFCKLIYNRQSTVHLYIVCVYEAGKMGQNENWFQFTLHHRP